MATRSRWQGAGATDIGRIRASNQDALLVLNDYQTWAVADGMGGHAGGDVASRLAIQTIESVVRTGHAPDSFSRQTGQQRVSLLHRGIRTANQVIRDEASKHPELEGMGTTLVTLSIIANPDPQAIVLHVGDSRAYLFRARRLIQLTRDHSLVEEYVRVGLLTQEEAPSHPLRHVLSRALGPEPDVESDMNAIPLEQDDLLLLCTDGLTKMVPDECIAETLLRVGRSPAVACQELITEANRRGGEDNVTVVIVSSNRENSN